MKMARWTIQSPMTFRPGSTDHLRLARMNFQEIEFLHNMFLPGNHWCYLGWNSRCTELKFLSNAVWRCVLTMLQFHSCDSCWPKRVWKVMAALQHANGNPAVRYDMMLMWGLECCVHVLWARHGRFSFWSEERKGWCQALRRRMEHVNTVRHHKT